MQELFSKKFILLLLILLLPSVAMSADYTKIHAHPRLFRTSTDTWAATKAKINGDATMDGRWDTFVTDSTKSSWTWGNVNNADWGFTFMQCLIGKVENDATWYAATIANNAVARTIVTGWESDDNVHLMCQALVYDWLYSDLTAGQRTQIKANIETACDRFVAGEFDDATSDEDYHNYATGWEEAVLMAGIALYGDGADGTENTKINGYIDWALSRISGQKSGTDGDGQDHGDSSIYYNFAKSLKATGGFGIFEGPGYFKHAMPEISWGIEAWDMATDRFYDMWNSATYFQIAQNLGYSSIYMHTPAVRRFKEEDSTYGLYNYFGWEEMSLLSLLEGRYANAYFQQAINDNWATTADWSGASGEPGNRGWYFLFCDPTVSGSAIAGLNKDLKLGDYTIMKNGWTTSDEYIVFKAGYHWKSHAHDDHGDFQIYKGNNLLTGKSGWYDTSWWTNDSHRMAWCKQAISGNCITIYVSTETQTAEDGNVPNSGSQRMMNYKRNPPFSVGGTVLIGGGAMLNGGGHDVADAGYGVTNRYEELARYATVEASELNHANYAYTRADLTKAYTNAYSEYGDNISAKATLLERELVYLRPEYIVVYDKVNVSTNTAQVAFVTHQPYASSVYDTDWHTVYAGTGTYNTGYKAKWDYGTDRVYQQTLLPSANYKYFFAGGTGYSCWIESTATNYPPDPSYRDGKAENDPAFLPYRLEVQPTVGSLNNTFLTVFDSTSTAKADISTTNLITSATGNMQGVFIDDTTDWVVMFSTNTTTPSSVSYTATGTGAVNNLICGLKANTVYALKKDTVFVANYTSSAGGEIYFENTLGSEHTFDLTEGGGSATIYKTLYNGTYRGSW